MGLSSPHLANRAAPLGGGPRPRGVVPSVTASGPGADCELGVGVREVVGQALVPDGLW